MFAYECITAYKPRQKKHCYLPDTLQGLSERALGSALELFQSLSTATLLLHLHWGFSYLLTHLHTYTDGGQTDRAPQFCLSEIY